MPEDLPHVARLHEECFADAWNAEFIGRLLAQPGAFGMVAMDDGTQAGFVLARANAGEAEILSVGVRFGSRRRSLATALVQGALDLVCAGGAVEVFLEVAVENGAARALYRRLGFLEVGSRPAYYGQGMGPRSEALILRRALPG
jgi:ribosomal-protein-alanine N-acetyltransferase